MFLSLLAEGISKGVGKKRSSNDPLVLIFDQDVGSTVGSLLRQEKDAGIQVVSIDGILLQDFDFVDIGSRVLPAGVVPVIVKSLAFCRQILSNFEVSLKGQKTKVRPSNEE